MQFVELLNKRRSVRKYLDKPVPKEVVEQIIQDCLLAPSAGNGQPWKFVVIQNREVMKRMSDESKKNILARIEANPDDYAKRYEAMLSSEAYNVYYNAPCLVLILGKATQKNIIIDCTLAASYFMMSAAARGLGTCWVNLGMEIQDPEMLATLGIPEDHKMIAPLILGYPEKIPPAPKRKPADVLAVVD